MQDERSRSLEDRMDRLEKSMSSLERLLDRQIRSAESLDRPPVQSEPPEPAHEDTPAARAETVTPAEKIKAYEKQLAASQKNDNWLDSMLNTENWLGKVGIGLLLFGLVFLFKYSVDQGWLTPTVRLLFGLGLGVVLVVAGIRSSESRRYLSLVLIGGGIASFLVTGFAAYQVFSLVSHPVAYVFLVAVTLVTFLVSLRQDEPVLALIGVIGGFATPFLLYTEAGTLAGLLTYSSALVACALMIYFFRGWRSLLWLTVLGGWAILLVGLVSSAPFVEETSVGDRIPMQAGLLVTWILFAILPYVREIISDRDAESHPRFFAGDGLLGLSKQQCVFRRQHLLIHFTITPLLTLVLSSPVWELSDLTWGLVIMSGAMLYGGAAILQYRSQAGKDFFPFNALAALILFTISLAVLLEGNALLLAIALEAVILHELGLRTFGAETRLLTHLLFVILLIALVDRLLNPFAGELAFLNANGLTDLAVLGAGVFIAIRSPSQLEQRVYAVAVHVCFLALLYRDLIPLDNGQGIITIAWGVYAVGLFMPGLTRNMMILRLLGGVTLLVVVGKLFLVDLVELETIWRVLLFMGFGVLFLLLSYFFKSLVSEEKERED